MKAFKPCGRADIASAYGAASTEEEASMLTQGSSILEQYAPALKTLLFDEDPRTAYAKKEAELNGYIASYKATTSSFSKGLFGKKITELRAELSGLSRQIEDLKTAETTKQFGKILGISLLGGGLVVILLVGNLFREKAATERYRRTHGD